MDISIYQSSIALFSRQVQSEGYLVAVGSNDGNTSMLQLSSSLSQCNRWVTGQQFQEQFGLLAQLPRQAASPLLERLFENMKE